MSEVVRHFSAKLVADHRLLKLELDAGQGLQVLLELLLSIIDSDEVRSLGFRAGKRIDYCQVISLRQNAIFSYHLCVKYQSMGLKASISIFQRQKYRLHTLELTNEVVLFSSTIFSIVVFWNFAADPLHYHCESFFVIPVDATDLINPLSIQADLAFTGFFQPCQHAQRGCFSAP